MRASHTIRPVFDDPNLVSCAGLVPALGLAGSAGLYDLLDERVSVPSPNATAKTVGVIGGMLAGAGSIDKLDLLRHGGMKRLFGGVRAPSTLGTFLRCFTHGHVQQLDAAGASLLAGLADRVPCLLTGTRNTGGVAFIDVDDTVRQVHGYAKQAAAYSYTRQRGLNVQLATLSSPTAAPVIARARLRRDRAGDVSRRLGVLRVGISWHRDPPRCVVQRHRPDDRDRHVPSGLPRPLLAVVLAAGLPCRCRSACAARPARISPCPRIDS